MEHFDGSAISLSKYPPVSVAMATYNGAKFLEEQLDSILSQTQPPQQIIVCDDISTDGTAGILERYQSEGLLNYYVNDERLGYVENFKKAVSLARPGNYIALSDQDDIWLPRKIEAAMDVLLKVEGIKKPAMVYSDLILVDENKQLLNKSFRNELGQDGYQHSLETLLFGGFVNGCTMLMNPTMGNYFSSIPIGKHITHDTWIALIAYTFGEVGTVAEALIHYRRHTNNATDILGLEKKSRFGRLIYEISAAFNNKTLFERELDCVEKFYLTFSEKLTADQQKLILEFLKLHDASYLEKKIRLRKFFRGKWK